MNDLILAGKDKNAAQALWLELAASPAEHLDTLLRFWTTTNAARALDRTVAATAWPAPDPRIAARLLDIIDAAPFQAKENMRLWHLVYRLVLAHATPDVAERLRVLAPGYHGRIHGQTMGAWMEDHLTLLPTLIDHDHTRRPARTAPADLDAIAAALAANDTAAARHGLTRLWEPTRDATAARLVAHLGPPTPTTALTQHADWLLLAAHRDRGDLPRLLPLVGPKGRLADAAERCALLATFPPDPRIAARMADLLLYPEARQDNTLTLQLIATLYAHADRDALQRLSASDNPDLVAVHTGLKARLDGLAPLADRAPLLALARQLRLPDPTPAASEDPVLSERFGRLRDLLSRSPSADVWQLLCDLLDAWPDTENLSMAVDYARGHLDAHWPDALRTAPLAWIQRLGHAPGRTPANAGLHSSTYANATSDRAWSSDDDRLHPALPLARKTLVLSWWDLDTIFASPLGSALTEVALHASDDAGFTRALAQLPPALRSLTPSGHTHLLNALAECPAGVLPDLTELDLHHHWPDVGPLRAFLRRTPWRLRRLRLADRTNLTEDLAEDLAASPCTATLEELVDRDSYRITTAALRHLATLPALHTLDLSTRSAVPPDALATLLDPAGLPNLRHLHLRSWTVTADHVAALARFDHPLESLHLGALSDDAAEAFAALLAGPTLQRSLQHLAIGGPAVKATIDAIAALPALRHLAITGAELTPETLDALLAAGLPERLEHLDLTGNALDRLDALAARPWPRLERLTLSRNLLDPRAGALLATARLPALRTLELNDNPLKTAGVLALTSLPALAGLDELHLRATGFGPPAALALAVVPFAHLTRLTLDANPLKAAGAEALLSSPWLDELRRSNLEGQHHSRPLRMIGCSVNYALRRRFVDRFGPGVQFG